MHNVTVSVIATGKMEQIQRLTEFFSDYLPEIFQYSGMCFLVGMCIVLLIILVTFGIFKALSFFRQMADF